jgi:hypothetical protein
MVLSSDDEEECMVVDQPMIVTAIEKKVPPEVVAAMPRPLAAAVLEVTSSMEAPFGPRTDPVDGAASKLPEVTAAVLDIDNGDNAIPVGGPSDGEAPDPERSRKRVRVSARTYSDICGCRFAFPDKGSLSYFFATPARFPTHFQQLRNISGCFLAGSAGM